jgi:hypothetical protein
MAWLPTNYKVPRGEGQFMKLEEGVNRFRIMSKPVLGFEWWEKTPDGRKPHRTQNYDVALQESADQEVDGKIKHFWAFAVWNYQAKRIQTLLITQSTIMLPIENLVKDEDWGSPTNYDLVITKQGNGLDTEYTVQPKPAKEPPKEAVEAYKRSNINLEQLFVGGLPISKRDNTEDEEIDEEMESDKMMAEEKVDEINDTVPF